MLNPEGGDCGFRTIDESPENRTPRSIRGSGDRPLPEDHVATDLRLRSTPGRRRFQERTEESPEEEFRGVLARDRRLPVRRRLFE
ncbi:hypothetical protein L596_013322 [Steinernema carpocapsae]|uniref:Uncharacterized protein n=1 Tax=Steinernema carpocapsae TaxID=34508 RepID=A0A4U5NZZ3_STECR|nr:hypothetical protein L596_013322 [Steinernema carpocapsae]